MPYYIQRNSEGLVETVDEVDDSKEAYRLAAEYNSADQAARYYVKRTPCKAWRER